MLDILLLSCDSFWCQNFYNLISSHLNPVLLKIRFTKLARAIFSTALTDHAKSNLRESRGKLFYEISRCNHSDLWTDNIVDKSTPRAWITYTRICFLTCIALYILWIWCLRMYVNVPPNISFEEHAPISFYEKTWQGM